MNKQDMLKILSDFLSEFDRTYILPQFIEDISDILFKEVQGSETQLLEKLIVVLKQLDEFDIKISQINGHEILKNTEGLYSLHLKGKTFNVRILAKPVKRKFYLILAFNEKTGKGNTGYKKHITEAQNRLKEVTINDID